MLIICHLSLLTAVAQSPAPVVAEETAESVVSVPDVMLRINQFAAELQGIAEASEVAFEIDPNMPVSSALIDSYDEHIRGLEQMLRSVLSRWDTYQMAQQYEIAASDTLMAAMASLDGLRQSVGDSIARRKEMCQALKDFRDGEAYIQSQETVYKKLYKKAFPLSLAPKAAPLLAKVQAREALLFADVQARYDKMKAAVEIMPALAPRMESVEDDYIGLKAVSEKIQALAYKPLIARIKDYLLGFAAVAVLLLFFNLMIQKYSAAKKASKALKQYKGMLKNSGMDNEYPTI